MHSQPAAPIIGLDSKADYPFKTILEFGGGRTLELEYPWMVAFGCLGPNFDLENPGLKNVGAIVAKGICLEPCFGNPMPRFCELPTGALNAIGLEGVGVKRFISEQLPKYLKLKKPVIVNIWGKTPEECAEVAHKLDISEVAAIELNISCPNVKKGGVTFGTDPIMAYENVTLVRQATKKPLIVKLSPNVTNIVEITKEVVAAGADAVSLINTLLGMAIDIENRRPKLFNNYGGYSGIGIKPVALRMVNQVFNANFGVPIFGVGGISNWQDVLEFIVGGANAIMIGTEYLVNNNIFSKLDSPILDYMQRHDINHIQDLVGTVELYKPKK